MISIGLCGLNCRYSHDNLAIKYLKEACSDMASIDILDFTINEQKEDILRKLVRGGYTHIGFSVYIWNREMVGELIRDLKEIDPSYIIFAGGPEVSFDTAEFMDWVPVDYVMVGEGEVNFPSLIRHFYGEELTDPSIMIRSQDGYKGGHVFAQLEDLKDLPILYENNNYIAENKYVYYEASRGCPYNCEFCLSAHMAGVRFRDIETVLSELQIMLDERVNLVKFIDRSFNFNPDQDRILSYLINNDNGHTTFHLELHPSLIREETMEILKKAREDLFQFELGLQTTNEKTAKAIKRVGSFEEISVKSSELIASGAHIHMDLIAGLPYEDYDSFKQSFNDLHSIRPDKIQLGFLKLLRGSPLRAKVDEYCYRFSEYAPYEVISNRWLSYKEVLDIKNVEQMVESYYTVDKFSLSNRYLLNKFESPWDYYQTLGNYWEEMGYIYDRISNIDLYNILHNFAEMMGYDEISEKIIFDFYADGNRRTSVFNLRNYNPKADNELIRKLLVEEEDVFLELGVDPKNALRDSVVEVFHRNLKNKEKGIYYYFFINTGGEVKIVDFKVG